MLENLNSSLASILARTENIPISKTYNYAEQSGITGKPSIVATGETLKRFPLKIRLHSDFCSPAKILKEIEEKGGNHECFSYFQGDTYIGEYVIESFNCNILQTFKDVPIYAELEITLLENPDEIKVFQQQTKKTLVDQMNSNNTVSPTKMEKFKKYMKKTIVDNAFSLAVETIKSGNISGLGNIGYEIAQRTGSQIVGDIKNVGITKAFEVTNNYTKNLNTTNILDETQKEILKDTLNKIPKDIINSTLR